MAQRLKAEVRERIVEAATAIFVARGYEGARLADIAASAGISTGNIYRYFEDKNTLFAEIVPRRLAARMVRLLRTRVREIRLHPDWRSATVGGSTSADALLDFWIEHRLAVVILLGRAEGSPLEHIRPLVVAEMTRLASQQARAQGRVPPPETVFVIRQIFAGTIDMIVRILQAHAEPLAIRLALAAFWRFQLAGLQSLLSTPRAEVESA